MSDYTCACGYEAATAEELGDRSDPDAATLSRIFAAAGVAPKAVMHRLSW